MSHENDTDDGEDEPKSHHDYRIARNPRAKHPDEAGPRDPVEEMYAEADIGSGFEDVFEEDGDGGEKSVQKELEGALEDANFVSGPSVKKGDDPVDLSWSAEDFEDDPTEAELLAEIRDELARMNAADRERALKSLTRDSTHGNTDGARAAADAVTTLERLEARLEAEEQAEGLEALLIRLRRSGPGERPGGPARGRAGVRQRTHRHGHRYRRRGRLTRRYAGG